MTPTLLPGSRLALALLAAIQACAAAASEPAPASAARCEPAPPAELRDEDGAVRPMAPAAARQRGAAVGQDPGLGTDDGVQPADRQVLVDIPTRDAAEATLRREGHEALLSFPHALPPIDARALQECASGLLEGVSVGYDTLLLTLAPGATIARTDAERGLRLQLRHAPAEDRTSQQSPPAVAAMPGMPGSRAPAGGDGRLAEAAAEDDQGELRLRLLEAQIQAQTGQVAEARQGFEALRRDMPASPEPLNGLAGLALRGGRWRQALALYEEALLLDPGEPGATAAVRAIERAAGSRLRAEIEYRETQGGLGTGRSTAVIGGIGGHQRFGAGWRLGFATDVAQVDALQVQRQNGTVGSFSGDRHRAEVSLQHDGLDGLVAAGSLFLTGDTPGFGLRAELPDDRGVTALRAEYRRPNWDFFQSLIENGTRDRLAVGRRHQLTTDLTGRLELGANRYGIQGDRDVAGTISLNGELRLGNLAGNRGLSAAYVLDGEYLLRRTERTGADGQRFAPLQIVDREVHALTLGYAGVWGDSTAERGLVTYELSAGYGVDRYGKAGPLVAGTLGYTLGRLEVRLRGSYVENIGRARGTTTVLGGALTWTF